MLIVKRYNYTWYIHDNWVIVFSALLIYLISIIFSII